jgi:hypothetical protein
MMINWPHPLITSGPDLFEQLLQHKDKLVLDLVKAEKYMCVVEDRPVSDNAAALVAGKRAAILKHEEKISKLHVYEKAFEAELNKGLNSTVIEVQSENSEGGVSYTVASVEWWARKTLGISILSPMPFQSPGEMPPEQTQDQGTDDESDESDSSAAGGRSQASLMKTFAFLVEAFSQINARYRKNDGTINTSAIADELEAIAKSYSCAPDDVSRTTKLMKGQSAESIKGRIELAMQTRGDRPGWDLQKYLPITTK